MLVSSEIKRHNPSIIACSCHIYMDVVLHTHPVRGESHIQRNANGEVATNIPLFLQRTAPITHSFCEGCIWHDLHILVTGPFWCDWKTRAACAQKLHTVPVAASNNRDHMPWSLYYCLFAPHMYGCFLRAHPVRGESHIQRNPNREVPTVRLINEVMNGKSWLC